MPQFPLFHYKSLFFLHIPKNVLDTKHHQKIEELEREGKFDVDAEEDPATIVLTPENIDYLRKKMSSKLKRVFANEVGEKFLDNLLRNNKLNKTNKWNRKFEQSRYRGNSNM